jgi:hypothetical protein
LVICCPREDTVNRLLSYLVVAVVLGAIGLGVVRAIATNWDSLTSIANEEEEPIPTYVWLDLERSFWTQINESTAKLAEQHRLYRDEKKTPNWDTIIHEARVLQVKTENCDEETAARSYSGYVKAKKQWCPDVNKYAAIIEQAALAKSAEWFKSTMPALLGTMRTAPALTASGKPETK